MAVTLIAGTATGFIFPAAGKLLAPALGPLLMGIIFLASLKMRLGDLLTDLRKPKMLLIGLALILFVVPLLGALVPLLWPLAPMAYVGILLFLASPAAASTAFFAEVLGGRPTLGLNLSATSLLLCIATIPAIMLGLAGTLVQVDALRIVTALVQIIVIPFAAAMAMLRFAPAASARLNHRSLPITLVLLFLIYFAFVGAGYEEIFKDIAGFGIVAAILTALIAVDFATGYGLARLAGADKAGRITVTLGAGVKNGTVGLFVALAAFGPAVIPPIIAGGVLNVFVMMLFGKIVNRTSS